MRNHLRFYLGSDYVEVATCAPTLTLLDWLRLDQHRTGTKEGCNEGDCGACTVVIGKIEQGKLVYRAVNACILFLPMLDGCQILTVEHLKRAGELHPVQRAMVAFHASQCGFCTPGIVMSLFALWLNENRPLTARVEDVLAGNLCRCTGYRPIVEAALQMYDFGERAQDRFILNQPEVEARLLALQDETTVRVSDGVSTLYAPVKLDDLAALVQSHAGATLVAGATDVGLWVTKGFRKLEPVILLNRVTALREITETDDVIRFGAMVPLTQVHRVLGAQHPQIAELLRRFGSEQVRNSGTIGGNIANGSPIGDLPPLLLALGARLVLRCGEVERVCALDDFFMAYKQQNISVGEFVLRIEVPKLKPNALLHISKISKRFDEDISTVCGAFYLEIEQDRIKVAHLAYGGMAATPKRARTAEAALVGKPWSQHSAADAALVLSMDFAPLSDMRASAAYRGTVAANLIRRFALETLESGIETRVTRMGGHHA
jgi:xanthine dehydrogenase small subunit